MNSVMKSKLWSTVDKPLEESKEDVIQIIDKSDLCESVKLHLRQSVKEWTEDSKIISVTKLMESVDEAFMNEKRKSRKKKIKPHYCGDDKLGVDMFNNATGAGSSEGGSDSGAGMTESKCKRNRKKNEDFTSRSTHNRSRQELEW